MDRYCDYHSRVTLPAWRGPMDQLLQRPQPRHSPPCMVGPHRPVTAATDLDRVTLLAWLGPIGQLLRRPQPRHSAWRRPTDRYCDYHSRVTLSARWGPIGQLLQRPRPRQSSCMVGTQGPLLQRPQPRHSAWQELRSDITGTTS